MQPQDMLARYGLIRDKALWLICLIRWKRLDCAAVSKTSVHLSTAQR